MATYKELSKCILFYSAKDFLDSINKLFEYKFDKVPDQNKYILMYRPINTTEWKVKAISFCVKNHSVQREDDNYRLVKSIGNTGTGTIGTYFHTRERESGVNSI